MSVAEEKAALRRALKLRRRGLDAAAAGLALAERAAGLRPAAGAVVAGYWPLPGEIDPRFLMERLAGRGWGLSLPIAPSPAGRALLDFRVWRPGDALVTSAFGVLEPEAGAAPVTPSLILVPLLAFDRKGRRLGYGAGYYDRTLRALRARGFVHAVGVAFAAQEVEEVPVTPEDEPLDAILTETAHLEIPREGA